MTNEQTKELCVALMKADTEAEVARLLSEAGFWNNSAAWRNYGDYENNFNTIGNQQSRPDAALVEKLVNSEDARLMNACMERGVNPESPQSPQTIRDAVAAFFDDSTKNNLSLAGRVSNWSDSKRTEIARGITLTATGLSAREGKPCFTISDCGEGQTPSMVPETLLSLTKSNKLRIPFVQGKFNMGGTGVLKFSGRKNLQLTLTRRNPSIIKDKPSLPHDEKWSFTVVRREDPTDGRRSSVYTYLAPLGAESASGRGELLRFAAPSMPIFPEGRNPYSRQSEWGTLIKLFEYAAAGYSNSHILRKDGLLSRIDLLLSDPALPIRLHECRPAFKGHEGSFETTLTGLAVRLDDDKAENLEEGFPSSCPLSVDGESMIATIYAFKKGKAETYRRNEGIIFTVNGQTHGHLTKEFFNRKGAGRLNYIADSILVAVDCGNISGRAREDLFMNSRDRLSHNPIRYAVEDQLEEMLKQHHALRALKEARRAAEIQSKLSDEKPLEEILKSLLEQSPALSALFLQGKRAVNPFKSMQAMELADFEGRSYPTYFRFRGKEYGKEIRKDCHINRRCRIVFETDAANDYFSRSVNPGNFALFIVSDVGRSPVLDYVGPSLQNGLATLAVQLPANCRAGDLLRFQSVVTDPTQLNPFLNTFTIDVKPEAIPTTGRPGVKNPPSPEQGEEQRDIPTGISLPNIITVHESDWASQTPPFDKYTALRIGISDLPEGSNADSSESQDVYDFKINMDNLYLKSELKIGGDDFEMVRARWKYGLVLIGLALLHDDVKTRSKITEEYSGNEDKTDAIEKRVEQFTRAIAPVLLPMINSLGALELDEAMTTSGAGEAT